MVMIIADDAAIQSKYKEWCEENLGPIGELHCGWVAGWESVQVDSPYMTRMYMYMYVFRFVREIDLVAFKLKFKL